MIPAQPSTLARRLGALYVRRRARRRFAGVHACGIERLAPWDHEDVEQRTEHPLLIVANHPGWWDALMPIYVSLGLRNHDAYGVMEERQLSRFRFFTRLGMFSIDREDPRSALETIQYAVDLLRGSRRVLWYFPQGKIVPNDVRPIEILGGVGRIAESLGRATIVPLALRYELLDNERPDAWIRVGGSLEIEFSDGEPFVAAREIDRMVRNGLTATVDRLRADVMERRTAGYETVLRGKGSIDEWWSRVRGNRSLHGEPDGLP